MNGSPPPPAQTTATLTNDRMEVRPIAIKTVAQPSGVRGWLLALCIWLTVGPAIGMLTGTIGVTWLATTAPAGAGSLVLIFGGLLAIMTVPPLVTGLMLWTRARGAFTVAMVYLIIGEVLAGIVLIAALVTEKNVGGAIFAIIVNTLPLLYLCNSERVRLTYRQPQTTPQFVMEFKPGPVPRQVPQRDRELWGWAALVVVAILVPIGITVWMQHNSPTNISVARYNGRILYLLEILI